MAFRCGDLSLCDAAHAVSGRAGGQVLHAVPLTAKLAGAALLLV